VLRLQESLKKVNLQNKKQEEKVSRQDIEEILPKERCLLHIGQIKLNGKQETT